MDVDQDVAPADMVPFNFSRSGMVAQDQLRTLRTLDDQFARNLTHTLGAWLRTNITVAPLEPAQMMYGQFAENTANSCFVLPLRIEPLHIRAALSCDLSLAPAIIDLLLGGTGHSEALTRELTEIEDSVLTSLLDIVLRAWTLAWQPFGLEFHLGMRERNGLNELQMPLHERSVCSRFKMTLAHITGDLVFCMPSATITSALRAFAQRREELRNFTPEERMRIVQRLGNAHVNATMHFPIMKIRAEDLRSMTPGTLLPLPLSRGVSAEICIGGAVTFRAQPVRSGGHRAAQIVQSLGDAVPGGGAQ